MMFTPLLGIKISIIFPPRHHMENVPKWMEIRLKEKYFKDVDAISSPDLPLIDSTTKANINTYRLLCSLSSELLNGV